MSKQEEDFFGALEAQYNSLNAQFLEMTGPASTLTPDQKRQYTDALNKAQFNYAEASANFLGAGDATLQHLLETVQSAQLALDRSLAALGADASNLNIITSAVATVAAALSALSPVPFA